jgi:hypothetical protein
MLQYQIRRGKLASLKYDTGDVTYNLEYLKSTPAWNIIESLILAGDADNANKLYKLALSMAMCDNWARMKSGLWYLQYAGHVFCVCSAGTVEVFLEHENKNSRVPTDLAILAAEIACYIRRYWHENRVAKRTAERDTRREYRSHRSYRPR